MRLPPRLVFEGEDIVVQIELPEFEGIDPEDLELTPELIERGVEALCAALPQTTDVFIDGQDKPPASVFIETDDIGDESKWNLEA